jgi:hypothetical protein
MQAITKERWQEAQTAEISFQAKSYEEGWNQFRNAYACYFEYLGIKYNQEGKTILEVGPADFPAIFFCRKVKGIIVEPLEYPILKQIVDDQGFEWHKSALEVVKPKLQADEVWLFNVMQHIIDPIQFVDKCKSLAGVIRFFEPIDYPECTYHPHTYTLQDYRDLFGDCVRFYKGGSKAGFHTADCAYGVWKKDADVQNKNADA